MVSCCIVRPVVALAIFILVHAERAVAAEWNRLASPHGFEVTLPKGWGTRVTDGYIVIGPTPEVPLSAHASVRYLAIEEGKRAMDVARDVVKQYRGLFSRFTVNGPNALQNRMANACSMQGTIGVGYPVVEWRYFTLVTVNGKTARVSGFCAPTKDYARLRPAFVRCLSTFKLNAALRDKRRVAPPMTRWTDPKERAFTVPMPKAWTAEGGTVRQDRLTGQQFDFTHSRDASTFVMARSPMAPVYHEPNQTHQWLGWQEGRAISQTSMLMRYRGIGHYVKEMLLPFVEEQYGRVRLLELNVRPSEETVYRQMGMKMTTDRAEAVIAMRYEGASIKSKVWVTILHTRGQQVGLWRATVWAAGGPESTYDQAVDVAMKAMCGFKFDPRWQKMEADHQQKMHAIAMKGARDRQAIWRQHSRDMSDMRMKSWRENNKRLDELHRKRTNVIRGTVDLYNSETGETIWGAEDTSDHYYQHANDYYSNRGVVGTNVQSNELEANGTRLVNLDDLRR